MKSLQQEPTWQRIKQSNMKVLFIIVFASLSLLTTGCMENKSDKEGSELQAIFPKGELGQAENFTGKAWHTPLVANDTVYNTIVGNVYFEPGARSNWHTHPAGQILIITDGVGYYQEKGKPIQVVHKGDVIKCVPGVAHWHGASPKSTFTYIEVSTKEAIE